MVGGVTESGMSDATTVIERHLASEPQSWSEVSEKLMLQPNLSQSAQGLKGELRIY